jgi:beta-glucosidase
LTSSDVDPVNILSRMTLREKAGQLTMATGQWAVTGPRAQGSTLDAIKAGEAGSVLNLWSPAAAREAQDAAVNDTRLGIPLIVGFDVVHGHRTVFPIPLGETASFDPDLWTRTAAAAAAEALADGINLTFAPMLDVTRDPRWGRICEGAGEDPHVALVFAMAKIAGFQGEARAISGIAATAKHLGAYGAPLAGRDYASADVSPREMAEVHLPAFAAAVRAGVAAIMPSFNDLAGIPATANRDLLDGWLRKRLGFDGVIVSDYHAITELITHGVAADLAEAAALALRAGCDIDMMGGAYLGGLGEALDRGLITMAMIDAAVLRVLRLKHRLGLFENPCRGLGTEEISSVRFRHLAREAAQKSIVLLKNEASVLPLAASGGPIAVIGPLAQAAEDMLGSWSGAGRAEDCVTLFDGIRQAFPGRGVLLPASDGEAAALRAAMAAEVVVFCAGEPRALSGEASCRAMPDFPAAQIPLARALLATGKPLVLVLSSGRPVVLPDWLATASSAILAIWFLGSDAGAAVGDILAGTVSPGGRLPVTWPASTGQIPIHYARRRSGRPPNPADHYTSKYLDASTEPLFAFGHGLSYAPFLLQDLRTDTAELAVPDAVTLHFTAVNTGRCAASTVFFLFVQDPVASVARPVLALKRFRRVAAAAGERVAVSMTLDSDDLAFPGVDMTPRIENGRIDLLVGQRAVEAELARVSLTVTGGISHIPMPP